MVGAVGRDHDGGHGGLDDGHAARLLRTHSEGAEHTCTGSRRRSWSARSVRTSRVAVAESAISGVVGSAGRTVVPRRRKAVRKS